MGDWRSIPERALTSPFICRSGGAAVSCNMGSRRSVSLLAFALALALAWAAAVIADDEHARARAAREAGLIVSLQAILDRVQADCIGSPYEVEPGEPAARCIYKLT